MVELLKDAKRILAAENLSIFETFNHFFSLFLSVLFSGINRWLSVNVSFEAYQPAPNLNFKIWFKVGTCLLTT